MVVDVDGGPVWQHDHRRIAPGVDAPVNLDDGGRVRREETLASEDDAGPGQAKQRELCEHL